MITFRQSNAPRSVARWAAVGSLVASFVGLASCIKREFPSVPAAGPAVASTEASGSYGNGKYGEVPSEQVLPEGGVRAFTLQGDASKVLLSYVPVQGQPFSEALRAEVKEAGKNPWDLQANAKSGKAVKRGDVLLATFYVRTEKSLEESGEGATEFVFELGHDPWTKSVSMPVRAGREWTKVHVPFKSEANYAAGEASINLRVGFKPQIIEVGGVTVENFGRALTVAALPVMKLSYPGMEPDADWRKEAARRIEQHRKGDLRIVVKNSAGKPLPGAEVKARQVQHAFGFGTCVAPDRLTGPDNEKYQQVIPELFNIATLENNLKWVALAGDWGASYSYEAAKKGIFWLQERGVSTRGHVLVWPGWSNLPRYLKAKKEDTGFLRAEADKHIREAVTAVKGSVVHWDVVNEPFDNHDLLDLLGEDAMVDWFKLTRQTDPKPKLFINDYQILSGGGGDTPHRTHYEKVIQRLIEKGAPLDGIGMEGHFGTALTGPSDMLAILDRFAKFKKTIWVTEYDVVIDDEAVAGQFTRDFYTTLFSHPAVGGIVMWGFWDGNHWKSNSPMYRRDWSLKPSGEAIRELLLKTWRSDLSGKSDAQGTFASRGFYGDYEVEVRAGDKTKRSRVAFRNTGSEFSVVLD